MKLKWLMIFVSLNALAYDSQVQLYLPGGCVFYDMALMSHGSIGKNATHGTWSRSYERFDEVNAFLILRTLSEMATDGGMITTNVLESNHPRIPQGLIQIEFFNSFGQRERETYLFPDGRQEIYEFSNRRRVRVPPPILLSDGLFVEQKPESVD